MKTNFILFFVCILLCSFSFAQNKSEQINKNSKTVNIYTSLKRNPIAKQLRTSRFKIKIIKNKKKYNRKKIKKLFK